MLPLELELAGVKLHLQPSARSALRYRAWYGESVLTALNRCGDRKSMEGTLLRMCQAMLEERDAMPLEELARLARRDGSFFLKGLLARDALLARDDSPGALPTKGGGDGRPFDEYDILTIAAAAGLPGTLLDELPILHLAGVAGRYFALQDPDRKTYRMLDSEEMAQLYPRAKKKRETS